MLTGSSIVLFQERLKCFVLIELGRHTAKERQNNFFKLYFYYFKFCVCVMRYLVCQKPEGSDPLEMELEAVVSCLMWMLGIQFRSSRRSVHALNP